MPTHTRKERKKNKKRGKARAKSAANVVSLFTGPIPADGKKRKKKRR